jgi:hypothetical protein
MSWDTPRYRTSLIIDFPIWISNLSGEKLVIFDRLTRLKAVIHAKSNNSRLLFLVPAVGARKLLDYQPQQLCLVANIRAAPDDVLQKLYEFIP